MIQIQNNINSPIIKIACMYLIKHYNEEQFHIKIRGVRQFNHTLDNAYQVSSKLAGFEGELTIQPYKTMNPWSKVIGYAKGNTIYVNTRKLTALNEFDRAANFMHELMHLIGYSHDGNYVTRYNLDTVPYKVGNLFAEYLRKKYL